MISAGNGARSENDENIENAPESTNDDECGIILPGDSEDDKDPAHDHDEHNIRNQYGISFDYIYLDTQYDVLDASDRWCEAQVRFTFSLMT